MQLRDHTYWELDTPEDCSFHGCGIRVLDTLALIRVRLMPTRNARMRGTLCYLVKVI